MARGQKAIAVAAAPSVGKTERLGRGRGSKGLM